VCVIPRYKAVGSHKHRLGFWGESIASFWVNGKDLNDLNYPSRGNTIDRHLTVETAGEEHIKLIILTRWHINLRGYASPGATDFTASFLGGQPAKRAPTIRAPTPIKTFLLFTPFMIFTSL
jgi:hypothetical protein